MSEAAPHYGVREQTVAEDALRQAVEGLQLLGCAVVDGGYAEAELDLFADRFDEARLGVLAGHGGAARLARIGEQHIIRALLAYEPVFLKLACNSLVLGVCEALLGPYVVLNQQNGVINPPGGATYEQAAFHRDLPYQHMTTSRPLAISALFCIDPFTADNGATLALPATHKTEALPSEAAIARQARPMLAPRGSFILLDAMTFHAGGRNTTDRPRRAVNQVFSIPPIRQQIDLPALLGGSAPENAALRRLLGYELGTPASLEEYYAGREARLGMAAWPGEDEAQGRPTLK